eukprot:TRINITY_DN5715_c0_g1_i2.p1 TRINITY_DN5715_c0_g1~~TRINITY_DN5715_c0_g1_i2.p1  ORF type:complete len:202 (+),score=39.38 TRINITY_DN5715_c0_g1_i2:148-753(+)
MKKTCLQAFILLTLTILTGFGVAGSAQAVGITFKIDRTSADPMAPTFSGNGSLSFDPSAPDAVTAFNMQIETIGGDFVGPVETPAPRIFDYVLADVVSVSQLGFSTSGATGQIDLANKTSNDGAILMINMMLDFQQDQASGFCFPANAFAACVLGGGSSSGVEAQLTATPIPLPASVLLVLAGLGALAGISRRSGRASETA